MSLNQSIIAELHAEAANNRKMLEKVPCDNNTWKPHERSMAIGNLAAHIAELPRWIAMIMTTDELDLATVTYKANIATTTEELIANHDKHMASALAALENATDEDFGKVWTLRQGSHVILSMPRAAVLRSMAMSHMYHHRGQLSVYLRLLNIPVPGIYGPSNDDMAAMKAAAAAQAN